MNRNSRIALAAIVIIALIAVGVGAAYYSSNTPPAGGSPTVSIASPTGGAKVSDTFTVTVSTSNFNIPTQGHIHVYLDSTSNYKFGNGPTFTFTNVASGTHTIWAQLQNPDHSPLTPPVETSPITITVEPSGGNPTPTVSITSPSSGATVSDTFSVTVSSTNFNVPAQGHYHVYLDGQVSTEKMAFSQMSTVTFNDVSAGTHTVTVALANPDHTALQPSVSQTTTVNVEQSGGNKQPTISIVSPTSGATVQGPAVTVSVSSTNMPSGGYYYVTLSNGGFITGSGPTFTFPSVTSGTHTITVDLRNPDGSMLSPAVSKTVTITVTSGAGGGGGGY